MTEQDNQADPTEETADAAPRNRTPLYGLVGFVALVVVVIGLMVVMGNDDDGPTSNARANAACQAYVRAQLKAPDTAKFASLANSEIMLVDSGGQRVVESYVDFQNGFGAMLRMTYTCTAKPTVDGKQSGPWKVINLKTDD